jgi:hypothetical protein
MQRTVPTIPTKIYNKDTNTSYVYLRVSNNKDLFLICKPDSTVEVQTLLCDNDQGFEVMNAEGILIESTDTNLDTCPICINLIGKSQEPYITNCNHRFHKTCMDMHLKRSNRCPCCRKIVISSNKKRSGNPSNYDEFCDEVSNLLLSIGHGNDTIAEFFRQVEVIND